jgi:hypothetical protein
MIPVKIEFTVIAKDRNIRTLRFSSVIARGNEKFFLF